MDTRLDNPELVVAPADPQQLPGIIEALLFTMGEAISCDTISKVTGHDKKTIRKVLTDLKEEYKAQNRGIRIIEMEDEFQMCTNPDMYDYIIRLTHQPKKAQLTDVMLETLSIVAYKQPVTKAEIEQIRGVSCNHAINRLLEYDLICEVGRLNAPGRPILFGTTQEFMRAFGVENMEQLPIVSPEQMDTLKSEAEEEASVDLTV